MNIPDTSSHGDTPMCQICLANVKPKKKGYEPDSLTCQNPYEFDPEVKVKGHILIMNVRDTSCHDDTHMCLIWQGKVKP